MVNIKTLKHYENSLTVRNKIKQHVKEMQMLNLFTEQVLPIGTAIEQKISKNGIVITTIHKYFSRTDCSITIVKFGKVPHPM